MGTSYSITFKKPFFISRQKITKLINKKLQEINQSMSTFDPNSEISKFNQYSRTNPLPISTDLYRVLKIARNIYKISDGAWDGSVKPLINLWGFSTNKTKYKIPSDQEITWLLKRTGFNLLTINNNQTISKQTPLFTIDLASIAKGYGVDEVSKVLDSLKISDYLVEIGGEIFVSAKTAKRIGIAQPRKQKDTNPYYKILLINNLAVATSGDYQNYFINDGKRYSHIINPKTGKPVSNGIISTTIIASNCVMADGMATAIMAMDPKKGIALLNTLPDIEGLIIIENDDKTLSEYRSDKFINYIATTNIQ